MSCQIPVPSGFRTNSLLHLRFFTRSVLGKGPARTDSGPALACNGPLPAASRYRRLQGFQAEARPVFHSLCSVHPTLEAELKGGKKK